MTASASSIAMELVSLIGLLLVVFLLVVTIVLGYKFGGRISRMFSHT